MRFNQRPQNSVQNELQCRTTGLSLFSLFYFENLEIFFSQNAEFLLSVNGFLLKLLENPRYKAEGVADIDINSPEEIYVSSLGCFEAILGHLADITVEFDLPVELLEATGKTIVNLLFRLKKDDFKEVEFCNIVTSALNSLRFISQYDSSWSTETIGELLGISKSFMLYGLSDCSTQTPQRIISSQQAVQETQIQTPNKSNVRPLKSKKMKANKGKKSDKKKTRETQNEEIFRQPYTASSIVIDDMAVTSSQTYRTSDSDFSDNECNRAFVNRHKQSKVRQAALMLVSTLAQVSEKNLGFL